jgi:hypothetical protein
MKKFQQLLFSFLLVSTIISCKKEEVVTDSYVPIVFVHGLYGCGDSYTQMIQYFRANGYPENKLFTYDWNTLDFQNAPKNTKPLDDFIKDVKAKTGYDKVNIVGHSLGGNLTFNYCSNAAYAVNINRLAWLAPYLPDRTKVPSDAVPTLNIRTNTDYVVEDTSTIPIAINVVIPNKDHNEIASCEESFIELFKFFNDGKIPTTMIPESKNVLISGRLVSFIENIVSANNKIEIYEVSAANGERLSAAPVATLFTDAKGYYKNFNAKKNTYYEFQVSTGKPGDRPIHFYFEPFKSSNHMVYLRTYPPQGSLLNIGFNAIIPFTATQGVSIFFSVSKTVLLGRDDLVINGNDCVNTTFAAKELNTLAYFMFDNNRNSVSDYTSVPLFTGVQSFKGMDFSLPANGFSTYDFNGRTLHTYNWPSTSKGLSVAMFY